MKKFFQRVVLVAVAMAATQWAVAQESARLWRIHPDLSKGANFSSINDAMESSEVTTGDVLYLDPSCMISTEQKITKKVTVIGTGWGFNDKPYLQSRLTGNVVVNAAATIIGVAIEGTCKLAEDNVKLERCYINTITTASTESAANAQIYSCYICSSITGQGANDEKNQKWEIKNCYVEADASEYAINKLYSPLIENCILNNTDANYPNIYDLESATVKNCILVGSGTFFGNLTDDCTVTYNCIYSPNEVATYVDNTYLSDSDLSGIFVNTGIGGAQFKLCEESPASGKGEGSIDCGIYAGTYSFVPCGYPQNIHHISSMSVPTHPTDDKITVSLKIVKQND